MKQRIAKLYLCLGGYFLGSGLYASLELKEEGLYWLVVGVLVLIMAWNSFPKEQEKK